jgi:predicted ATPase
MKLTNVEVKNYRSFLDRHDVDMGDGVNFFVGPNNCGKSNLLRAVALALDPDAPYDPAIDRPMRPGAVGAPLATRISLTFSVGNTGPEQTLLRHAQAYEHAVRQSRGRAITKTTQTFANDGVVKLVTGFAGSGRQVSFQAKGMGGRSLSADRPEAIKLEEQFRKVVRFAVVRTGEDLESLLAGKFQEILHLVISDHLREQMDKAEKARLEYVQSLQDELLEPLRALVEEITSGMFPEVNVATLIPDVPAVSETISSVDVQLGDAATTTPLSEKGTGLRGAVLTALLQYLADQSARSLVLAVEEPESFLHPAAQEAMGRHLEGMSKPDNVSLLVTTHSPYVMTRDSRSRVSQLTKNAEGWTSIPTTVRGDSDRADVLGSLYSEAGMAKVLERAMKIAAGTRAVLVTEGHLDGTPCRRAGARGSGRRSRATSARRGRGPARRRGDRSPRKHHRPLNSVDGARPGPRIRDTARLHRFGDPRPEGRRRRRLRPLLEPRQRSSRDRRGKHGSRPPSRVDGPRRPFARHASGWDAAAVQPRALPR